MFNDFDRIKISAELNEIVVLSEFFTKKVNSSDIVISEEYKSVGLRINVDYSHNKIVFDISSKILGRNYSDKINITNIRDVYLNISKVVEIKAKHFYSLVPKYCQVTKDIESRDIPQSIETMFRMSRLQSKYKPSPKCYNSKNEPTSFFLKKNVISRDSSEYISIYNKLNELFDGKKAENISFLNSLNKEERFELKKYFTDKVRIESTYNSMYGIRNKFGLGKNYNLYQLLTSKCNAIEMVFDNIYGRLIGTIEHYPDLTYKDFDRHNTLKLYNNDLDAIYELHCAMGSKIQKSKMLQPYKAVLHKVAKVEESTQIKIIRDIKNELEW